MAFCSVILCFGCVCCSQVEIIMEESVHNEMFFCHYYEVCTQRVQSVRDAPL